MLDVGVSKVVQPAIGVPGRRIPRAVFAIAAHDTTGQFAWLWHIYLVLTVVVGVLVTAAIVVAAVRFRRRAGRAARDLRSAPRLEAVYLGVIVLIVIGLLAATYRVENHEDALTTHPFVRVEVTASQWQWQFTYPASGVRMSAHNIGSQHPQFADARRACRPPRALHAPLGRRPAQLLHPRDAVQALRLPELTNRFVLTFPQPGRMLGECAQFCGWDHAEMRFEVILALRSRVPARGLPGAPDRRCRVDSAPAAPSRGRRPSPGSAAWIWRVAATDHKSLGLRLFGLCGVSSLLGGSLAPDHAGGARRCPACSSLSHQEYNELFTMHGSTMVYLVVQPLALALGVYLVPLQIGARRPRSAPRLALWCVWLLRWPAA